MNTAWPEVALVDLCDVQIGKTPPRKEQRFWGSGHRWLSIADMDQGRDLSQTSEQITQEAVDELRCRAVEPGTVLLSFKLSIGKVGIARKSMFTNEAIAHLPILDTRLDRDFLYWALRTIPLTPDADRAAMGATLNKAKLKRIPIPLPPLNEQRRIAAVLDAADALRVKRSQVYAKLDRLADSVFLETFGDPVGNPLSWDRRPFEDLCPTHLGKMLDKKQQTGEHLRPYLRNTNVQWFGFELDDLAEMDFDQRARAKYRLEPGDVLICEGGRPGRAAVWEGEIEECYFQKALHRGRPDPALATGAFIVHLLHQLATRGGLGDHVSSATIAHLTGKRLKSMRVIAPPVDLQARFEEWLAGVGSIRRRAQAHADSLDVLFGSLQQRAFRGEL